MQSPRARLAGVSRVQEALSSLQRVFENHHLPLSIYTFIKAEEALQTALKIIEIEMRYKT